MFSRRRYLTKSLFKLALECPTRLYYVNKKKYASTKDDNEFLAALAEGGFQVGELAKCIYPKGVEIESLEHKAALKQTQKLLKQENVVLFEPAIAFGDFFVRVDILKKNGKKIDLIEVKAKSFENAKEFVTKEGDIRPKWQPYLYDVAFQTWVFEQAYKQQGFQVRPFLMLTDKTKTAPVDGLNQKFKLVKVNGRTHVELNGRCLKSEANMLTAVPVAKHVQRILQGKDAALCDVAFAEAQVARGSQRSAASQKL